MKTIKLILSAILLMMAYVANAQTIQVYKDGAVVKEYSSAEVDSVVYKPAAAQPRYYYYAGWDCPSSVEADDKYLVKLVNEANGTNSVGGFVESVSGDWVVDTTTGNRLTNPNGIRKDTVYVAISDKMKLYDADNKILDEGEGFTKYKTIRVDGVDYTIYSSNSGYYTFGVLKIK